MTLVLDGLRKFCNLASYELGICVYGTSFEIVSSLACAGARDR